MAKVIVTPGQDLRKIADLAGGDPNLTLFDPDTDELEVADVTQAALDTAFLDYDTNQVAIDARTLAAQITRNKNTEKTRLDSDRILLALLRLLIRELNILRALHGLPDRTFAQLRTAIRNQIDTG